ncbi:uncharacterized protein LOC112052094 [Bicyclus anynana]|uniref:Uncharacterized protein LOC112052094 n=1 Tax=Bicyclus anynana TaxID=110368 RepID=A0A6J1NIN7_BICAN|nr:uncharacterized protein LOC112052094 [Bicyclus anynana]
MASKLSAKFLDLFKNLKSDAVPRPPRQNDSSPQDNSQTEAQNDNVDFGDDQEEIFVEQDDPKKGKKKPKYKKSFSTPNRDTPDMPEDDDRRSSNASSTVNTQATGNVINIVNSNNVRCGNELVYYMGPVYGHRGQPNASANFEDEEPVEKTNLIIRLLEATNKPEHDYIEYISKHLGKNWYSFFRRLGYKQGEIETVEIDMAKHGVAEARYKLLLDWIRNDDDGTLGKLANVLWEDGERQIVKEMAAMYNKG